MSVMRAICRAALAAVVCAILSAGASAQSGAAPVQNAPVLPRDVVLAQANRNTLNTDAQIYLLRGLANVFSRGMDELAAKLTADGFSPVLINHRGWQNAADTIAQKLSGRTHRADHPDRAFAGCQ